MTGHDNAAVVFVGQQARRGVRVSVSTTAGNILTDTVLEYRTTDGKAIQS